MTIEAELIEFLDGNIKSGGNKKRDIEIIKYYYGLHESPWPTLDETANRFNIGTRERIRQLLNCKFRDYANKDSITSLRHFVDILQSREYWLTSEFEKHITATNLISQHTHVKGIFNLIEDLNIDCGYEFYSPELKVATRNSIGINNETCLLKKAHINDLRKLLKKAQGLPGRCGIANLNYIKEDLGDYYKLILFLIEKSKNSWVKANGSDYWYIFENRDNTIINYCEKIFGVIHNIDSYKLATTFRNSLDGRSYHYPYPPVDIIHAYLKSSIFLVNSSSDVKFIGETTKLNDIEKDILIFFENHTETSFSALKKNLLQKGYGSANVLKTTNHSPLIYVDKTQGRTRYTYSLIGRRKLLQDEIQEFNSYELYLRRLRALLEDGTDDTREQVARKEQHILQEWLFKDKTHENCAICGREFSIQSLVTAHKKPRANCNDAERLDPYIVMPVCLMGCDYFYEKMFVYINGMVIEAGLELPNAKTESSYIEKIVGRRVDPRWLLGEPSFFRSPNMQSPIS
ncbi:hypothetical protein MT488_05410 [Enterobacter ludwigii]|jgi:hypothetical protein|uniref:hypothetical protein n=1 Tax=Enterobacter ludwigii TaxID=299767 RepID=UPI001FB9A15F|nr:hypothetical protein [Enterobacter ludwigii]EKS7192462.1 hypothetical protein [Enterobacter ludwigii]EKS7206013.1 hypothetical protein [Enterobacter ludwigii]MDK9949057.1 hypothetical protein [Enterobacter ludwigii]UOH52452.1 hypothetical protein MT488_05410 [Enterobacter ludwigii]HDR2689234.1 hypothetical protein [Enterobacter ludwigii]